jgi:hypothetical protein
MLTARLVGVLALMGWLMAPGLSSAAESQKVMQLSARILPRASLSLDRNHIALVGYEDQKVIADPQGPVQITAKGRAGINQPLTLTVRADSDLEGFQGRIPIQQVKWRQEGSGFLSGTLDRSRDQLLGRWATGGAHPGGIEFFLRNDAGLTPGEYTGAVTLTLTSP